MLQNLHQRSSIPDLSRNQGDRRLWNFGAYTWQGCTGSNLQNFEKFCLIRKHKIAVVELFLFRAVQRAADEHGNCFHFRWSQVTL